MEAVNRCAIYIAHHDARLTNMYYNVWKHYSPPVYSCLKGYMQLVLDRRGHAEFMRELVKKQTSIKGGCVLSATSPTLVDLELNYNHLIVMEEFCSAL